MYHQNTHIYEPTLRDLVILRYENAANPPHIFVSPFRRTVHTALYVASALNSKIQIEDGLVEKRHGLWNRTKMTDCFSKHIKYFNTQ